MAEKQVTTWQLNSLSDEIAINLRGVAAIIDAARILAALERTVVKPEEGSLKTGEGYANGETLRDVSLHDLLYVGLELTHQANEKAEELHQNSMTLFKEVRHG